MSYICSNCSYCYHKWVGKCSECGAWDSVVESSKKNTLNPNPVITKLSELEFSESQRLSTGISELDRTLGGGMVPGSVVLVGGEPGIGKSTLLLQVACLVAKSKKYNCLYISGEESVEQIFLRAKRLNFSDSDLQVSMNTYIDDLLLPDKLDDIDVIIIDSIQTVMLHNTTYMLGTSAQITSTAQYIVKYAKTCQKIIFIVGQVTKEGSIAGPKILEHMVDTVLYFEGDSSRYLRMLRAFKNRYGSINEIALFHMSEKGLEEIDNPSGMFLTERKVNNVGSTTFSTIEGSRAILVELQALVVSSYLSMPRRVNVGWDSGRLAMLLAVLQKCLSINFSQKDVFMNVTKGLKIIETGADLSVITALISAYYNKPFFENSIMIGEVGLTGEIRSVSHIDKRLNEANRLGFKLCFLPNNDEGETFKNMKLKKINHVKELADLDCWK